MLFVSELCSRHPRLNLTQFGLYEKVCVGEYEDAANYFQSMQFDHPDYTKLAARILLEEIYVSRDHVPFSEYFKFHSQIDYKSYNHINLKELDSAVCQSRDYDLSFVAIKTLRHSYLLKDDRNIVTESPQYFFMRCAICVSSAGTIDDIVATYCAISNMEYIHSSATLFNACKHNRYYSSCFVMSLNEDNIFDKMPLINNILLSNGGLGICISGCSPCGPYNGYNPRVNRMQRGVGDSVLSVLNAAVNSINPRHRRGSMAVYLDVWHPDVLEFIVAKMPHGDNTYTELFYGLNINNMFMECVISDNYYYLIDPNKCPELVKSYSEYVYKTCIQTGNYVRKIKAREILACIIKAQGQSGVPYIINIEQVNHTSNHKNIGKILCGNLCTEIFQYHDEDETAVCNLASVNVSRFIRMNNPCNNHNFKDGPDGCGCFDFGKFEIIVKLAVRNLNQLIDYGEYPDVSCSQSNTCHRPIGLGVQGLFDAIQKLNMIAGDQQSRDFNASITEHLYYYSLTASVNQALHNGRAYETFKGSDFSRGILQFDYYANRPANFIDPTRWISLKKKIVTHGIANSLLTACMPTATVSNIFGTSEGVEPYTSNVYIKSLQSGNLTIINPNLVELLMKHDLYNTETIDKIIKSGGSVTNLNIDDKYKQIFKTAYEISPNVLQEMARDRSRYVDQGQSLNMFIRNDQPDVAKRMIQSYADMYWMEMKNFVYYVYGEAPSRPMDPTISCNNNSCCQ